MQRRSCSQDDWELDLQVASPEAPVVALPTPWDHPSYAAVQTLAHRLAESGFELRPLSRVAEQIGRAAGLPAPLRPRRPVLVPVIGPQLNLIAAASSLGTPVAFAWDVWKHELDLWRRAPRRYGLAGVLVTATDSERLLSRAVPALPTAYVADAITMSDFERGRDLRDRRIHVLELGRRHSRWHDAVAPALAEGGRDHLFQVDDRQVIFEGRAELLRGLSDSAVSIAFPRSITHPQQAEGVEALTQRYLESIAARCLVLGHAPADLIDLFGYNPVLEVDWNDPVAQIESVLADLDSHQELVDRNRVELERIGDWRSRAGVIKAKLNGIVVRS